MGDLSDRGYREDRALSLSRDRNGARDNQRWDMYYLLPGGSERVDDDLWIAVYVIPVRGRWGQLLMLEFVVRFLEIFEVALIRRLGTKKTWQALKREFTDLYYTNKTAFKCEIIYKERHWRLAYEQWNGLHYYQTLPRPSADTKVLFIQHRHGLRWKNLEYEFCSVSRDLSIEPHEWFSVHPYCKDCCQPAPKKIIQKVNLMTLVDEFDTPTGKPLLITEESYAYPGRKSSV